MFVLQGSCQLSNRQSSVALLSGRSAQSDSAGATAHLLKVQAANTNGMPAHSGHTDEHAIQPFKEVNIRFSKLSLIDVSDAS